MQETWVRSLGQEDPLEKEMATHSSILAWKIPWTEDPGRLQSMGSQRVRHNWATSLSDCHSTYKLNKLGDNIQPWCIPFAILNQSWHCSMSGSNCCFLSCIQVYVCQSCILSPCLFNFFAQYISLKSFPCPSLSPRVCSNSCLLSLWCYLTISSSAALFSFCLQSFPASESFPMGKLFTSVSL